MTTQNIYDMTDTWNAGGTAFNGIKLNVTDTASAAASLLMNLQVGGAARFQVSKSGIIITAAGSESAPAYGFSTQTNYGMFQGTSQGGNGVSFTCAGTTMFHVGQNGGIGTVQVGPVTWATAISASADLGIARTAAGIAKLTNGTTGGASLQFHEVTAPSAPPSDNVRLFAQDNGAGKTQLMALFPTGAAQQVAIEP